MAAAGSSFQLSNQVKLDRTVQEVWHTDTNTVEYSLLDSIGNRSRVLRVKVHNPVNIVEVIYKPMRRVRLVDDFGLILFLGRIVSVEPDYAHQLVVLTCRDFLDDLSDRTVEAAASSGDYAGITKSRIVELILQGETYAPTYQGLERQLAHRIGVESSSYTEYMSRGYGQQSEFQTITSDVPGNYIYRGIKTGIEAINDLAQEDAQQDLVGFYYTPTPTNPSSSNHIDFPAKYPRAYWKDLTHEIHGEKGGVTYFITPQTAQDTTTPESADILYFGSNSQFDGLRYTFVQYGSKITSGTYAGTLQWQYWNGTAWTGFTPTADAKFGVDSGKIYGTTYWTAPTDWVKRDLGTTPDMHTANDATQSWAAPFASSGTTLPEDVDSIAISKVDHGDERRGTTRYWVRVYARTGAITTGYIATVALYTKPNLFHDFRCEDPEFLSEIWKYTHNATTGREGHGGTWLALNMTGGNAGTGSRLLWDTDSGTTNFIGGNTETWYFGSEKPFNGLSFRAFQDDIPDYSNVKFVWQWYSNYYGSLGESWQTISGLTITGNTVANPTVVTTERHHLDTGDSVTISGSNSTPSLDGTHTVTVISATTFSVAVNVSVVGTAGHVVCNNHITATEAMSGSGVASWTEDTGIIDQQLYHWNLDVRWDIDEVLATTARPTSQFTTIPEYDDIHLMDAYPYRDLASIDSSRLNKEGAAFGINSATVANPTVLTASATAGGTTANHNLQTGDQIFLTSTNSTPSLDGIHTVTRINATTVSIPVNVTSAGDTGVVNAVTRAPNEKYLYWVRCYITTGTPTEVAVLRSVQTANVGTFRYFDRGSEPWVTNTSSTVNGAVATTPVSYCYRYDTSASAGSKFTDYSPEIQSSTSDVSFGVITNTLANPTVVTTAGVSSTISGNTVATRTVVTTSAAHGLLDGDEVRITSSNSTPAINGLFIVDVLSTTTFSISATVTVAGTAGTVSPQKVHGLSTGHKVVITNSNSTPTINGTHAVTVLSTTTFSIAVNVTTAGTAGTVVPEKVTALDGGQVNDAIYFGSDEPFTQLRLNISDVLTSAVSNISSVTWEYYKGETTDDWSTLTHADYMFDFKTSGTNSLIFDMPSSWRTVQPGIKEANATDQSFGKTAYYVRARISSITGSPSGTAKIIQGLTGPNLWHPNLEVGTLATVASKRQSDPLSYGLTLTERAGRGARRMPITAYEIKDHSFDFVNKVGVRGQAGAYGMAEDTDSIATYGIVKERIVDDSTLITSVQCEAKARAVLESLKPGVDSTIRECRIRLSSFPIYSYLGKPAVVRAGDLVNVNIATAGILNEKWLLYASAGQLTDLGWSCELTLFRDLAKVFEPGVADRRLIRDLVTKSRETANAVFQPLDKAVVGGLDFLPEGPGRFVGREEYKAVGTSLNTVDSSDDANDWGNEFRWTKKLYLNHKAKEFTTSQGGASGYSLDLIRVDHLGISPAFDEVAKGGAGLTLISRDGNTANKYGAGSATSNFHPGNDEATLYLKKSATNTQGAGLYLAHRNIFNSGTTYNEWTGPLGDTDKLQAEVMTGFTGFVSHTDLDANARFTINLPALDSAPLIFTTICGHEGISGTPGNWTNAACNVYRWTTSSSKYTAVQMEVVNYPNNLGSDAGNYTITAITAANPTVITTTGSMSNGRAIWIGESNSTPAIDGLYTVSNKAGSNPYTYTLTAIANSSFPVNVTGAGTAGKIMSMGHYHEVDQAQSYDYSDNAPAIGIMYMVIYNSGKNTDGLNSHFSQNHVNHG